MQYLNWQKFGTDVRLRLGETSMRAAEGVVGISRSTISRAARGLSVDAASFVKLCDCFGLDPMTYLVGVRNKERAV